MALEDQQKKFGSGQTADESESIPSAFMDEGSISEDGDLNNDLEEQSYHGSHTAHETTTTEEDEEESDKLQFAKRETKAVLRLRLLVFDFLILATIAVSLIVYFTTTRNENEEYESQYESAATSVLDTFLDIAQSKLAAITSVTVALEVFGESNPEATWPFITLPRFQERTSTALTQSGALYLQVNPVVGTRKRKAWEQYAAGNASQWIEEGLEYQENTGMMNFTGMSAYEQHDQHYEDLERWPIWFHNVKGLAVTDKGSGPYLPTWQTTPILYNGQKVNENIFKSRHAYKGANESLWTRSVVVDKFVTAPPGGIDSTDQDTAFFSLLLGIQDQELVEYPGDPFSQVFFPLFDTLEKTRVVGVMVAWIRWMEYFQDILPDKMKGIVIVLNDTCSGEYSYQMDGPEVQLLGEGDLHDLSYNGMVRSASFESVSTLEDGTEDGLPYSQDYYCSINIRVYPSNRFHSIYNTNTPALMTAAVVLIFVCTALLFIVYDRLVERRQKIVMASAQQTDAIVSSLFPKNVRDRLMQAMPNQRGAANGHSSSMGGSKRDSFMAPNRRLKGYLSGSEEDDICMAPIADLFPFCTVLFADIAGFTAWSSTRDPAQVFILLQTVYQAFDKIAKRRKVFKVETIGDSYVAVTGLPEPQDMHAVIMARFAAECRIKMNQLVNRLETTLGPDTADLSMRFGLHSGPVTAGVLRGDRARFQLFGDTVNTAARMESTGERDMIQISHATYELLTTAGKHAWVKPRTDCVKAKGKGTMKTYWLQISARRSSTTAGSDNDAGSTGLLLPPESSESAAASSAAISSIPTSVSMQPSAADRAAAKKQERLVNWMVELFHEHIRMIVAHRSKQNSKHSPKVTHILDPNKTSLDEVAEVIHLPRFDAEALSQTRDMNDVDLGPIVVRQLHQYISTIASHYHDNAFHNWEHACHVTMATNKFLKRIASPDIKANETEMAFKLHDYTHGINSDPLTLLAIVFSALIHDVDHRGVSNAQLAKEKPEIRDKYRNKSIAEQNSLDLAWGLLMQDRFEELRSCMWTTEKELKRFRQVIVNVVLATDIFDPELNGLRKKRWERAFSSSTDAATVVSNEESHALRATIVIEHIIQASDVSHTMQHWHIYRKWNKRLFFELYGAYCEGRMAKDPSEFWYKGEIGFFDNYIIPLAKKLKDCQVFGVSSDECLNYAIQNRDEWKEKGQEIVAEMMQEVAAMELRPL